MLKKRNILLIIFLLGFTLNNCDCTTGRTNPNDPENSDYEQRQVDPPTLSPGETFTTTPHSVSISVPSESIVIYTTDGSEPAMTNGTQISANTTIDITDTTTVKAIACREYYADSEVVSETYTYDPPPPTPVMTNLDITDASLKMQRTETYKLTANASFDISADEDYSSQVTWTSGDDAIVSVDSSGNITAQGAGITTITASYTDNGTTHSDTCSIEVIKLISSFAIDGADPALMNNLETLTLTATVTYDDLSTENVSLKGDTNWSISCSTGSAVIENNDTTTNTSNPNAGKVTASKGGTCEVTTTYMGKSDTTAVEIAPVWQVVGITAGNAPARGFTSNATAHCSLFMYNGIPYVASTGSTLEVWKLNTSTNQWDSITPGTPPNAPSYVALAVVNDSGTVKPHVAFYNTTAGSAGLAHWIDDNTGSWPTKNNQLNGMNQIQYVGIDLFNTTPYIIGTDSQNSLRAKVWDFDGSTNNYVGADANGFPSGLNGTAYTSIAVYNNSGTAVPYAAFQYVDGNDGCHVNKFNGSNWVAVGAQISGNSSVGCKVQVNSTGIPYVVYKDSSDVITAHVWDGSTTWNLVDTSQPGNSVSTSSVYTGFAMDSDVPYVAFWDTDSSNTLNVKYHNGSDWVTKCAVGAGVTMPSSASGGSFDLKVYNGVPYILAADSSASNKATVFKCE